MKSICSLLILSIVLHSACGVKCLGADLSHPSHKTSSPTEQPACHHHAGNASKAPANHESSGDQHDKDNACGQAQTAELKMTSVSKSALQWTLVDVAISPIALQEITIRRTLVSRIDAPFDPSSAAPRPFILRI